MCIAIVIIMQHDMQMVTSQEYVDLYDIMQNKIFKEVRWACKYYVYGSLLYKAVEHAAGIECLYTYS